MNTNMHLSEDQMDDVLIGDPAAEVAVHLRQCVVCRERVEASRAPIVNFTAMSLAWSERRSATVPVTLLQAASSAGRRVSWLATATAVLLVGIAVPLTMHEKRTQVVASDVAVQTVPAALQKAVTAPRAAGVEQARVQPVAATLHRGNADAEIAHDNAMLQAIHQELDASVQPPADEFDLMAVGGTSAHERFAPLQSWD